MESKCQTANKTLVGSVFVCMNEGVTTLFWTKRKNLVRLFIVSILSGKCNLKFDDIWNLLEEWEVNI